MDVNSALQIISQVGFPIAVCLICFWYIYKMQESHKAEITEMRKAIENNTLVMTQLVSKLGGE